MKKFSFFVASLALCATLQAQHVTPLNINLMEFSLDSLRTQYGDNAPMYRAELERIQDIQDSNDKALSQVKKELKDEKAHAKDLAAYLKDKESSLLTLQKSYEAEQKALATAQSAAEKVLKKVQKSNLLNRESQDLRMSALQADKKEIIRMQDELMARQKRLTAMLDRIHSDQADLVVFNTEIQNKEVDLKQLEDTQKVRKASVKAELKNVKASMK